MACVPLPELPLPELPAPLTIAPPALDFEFDPTLCCKIQPFPPQSVTLDLPPGTLNPAVVAIINQNLALVQNYLDQLSVPCPRE